jgi:hypothetical protein
MILGCSCLHHTIRHHTTNKTDSENAGALEATHEVAESLLCFCHLAVGWFKHYRLTAVLRLLDLCDPWTVDDL